MSVIDRRDFVKSVSAVLGTAAVSGVSPLLAAQENPAAAKASSTETTYEVLNRFDYNVSFDSTGTTVGKEIKVDINVEAVKNQP